MFWKPVLKLKIFCYKGKNKQNYSKDDYFCYDKNTLKSERAVPHPGLRLKELRIYALSLTGFEINHRAKDYGQELRA